MRLIDSVRAHPIASYFVMAFSISWFLAFLIVARYVLGGQSIPYLDGVIMFPAMLVGPSVTGVALTRIVDGKVGLQGLLARMRLWRLGVWYAPAIVIAPLLILTTLLCLSAFVSSVFKPNFFVFGFVFGVIAGLLEEMGWTGFAIGKLTMKYSALASAIILGALWGLWHAPVVDFLGAAYPHGAYWLPFYLSFIALIMAIRVLIVWLYSNTKSIVIAQVTHISSTGFLATLAPSPILPGEEAGWYAFYAATIWVVVAIVIAIYGKGLVRRQTR